MKTAIVPAQVTTVEDRIVGNLNFSQMILLVLSVFLSALVFAGLPPLMTISPYKVVFVTWLITICYLLAVRVKGKIVAVWLGTLLKYYVRPKYFIYNKNSIASRNLYTSRSQEAHDDADTSISAYDPVAMLRPEDFVEVNDLLANPEAELRFETTKAGGLNVRFKKI
jgi:hypothetical protein